MTEHTKKLLEKPEPPESNECCGSGSCCPCVWDYYRDQMKLWRAQQAELAAADSTDAPAAGADAPTAS